MKEYSLDDVGFSIHIIDYFYTPIGYSINKTITGNLIFYFPSMENCYRPND